MPRASELARVFARHCGVEELLSLARRFPRRSLEPGDVLLVDGESVDALYVLLEGALRIEKAGVVVATVTEPFRPACATIIASFSWFFAFKTECSIPRRFKMPESFSDFSIETVPTRIGWPRR